MSTHDVQPAKRPTDALVVADDLTGATDTGHSFAARGYRTIVRLTPDFDASEAVVSVVDTDSRYSEAAEAANRVTAVVERSTADAVYKKVDSTLRGNVRTETVAAAKAMDAGAAAVAPAFPSNGRVTAAGYHLVGGELVTDTEAGNDPDKPVPTSSLPVLLDGKVGTVVHADAKRVAGGAVTAGKALIGEGDPRLVAFDAVHDRHLEAVADATAAHGGDVLLVGSAGLAEHVRLDAPTVERAPAAEEPSGTAFGVVGSINPQTLAQLDVLPVRRVVELDPEMAVTDPTAAGEAAGEACVERLDSEQSVVLASARNEADVEASLDAAERAGFTERDARERVTEALGVAAEAVWTAVSPGGFFITGGTVAKGVLDRLGVGGIELRGEEVAVGVPVGVVRGGPVEGTPVVTKAGAFGTDSTVDDALEHLRCLEGKR
jgi:uncharacterized protein YgbK (DUF1537 family)